MNWAWGIVGLAFIFAIGTAVVDTRSSVVSVEQLTLPAIQEKVQDVGSYSFNYYFKSGIPEHRREQFVKAFSILSNATNNTFRFTEINSIDEADYIIEYEVRSSSNGLQTLGTSYILGKDYYPFRDNYPDKIVIMPQDINEESHCKGYPMTELHEIIHGLGISHSESAQSIMTWSSGNCINLINDTDTISKLQEEWGVKW